MNLWGSWGGLLAPSSFLFIPGLLEQCLVPLSAQMGAGGSLSTSPSQPEASFKVCCPVQCSLDHNLLSVIPLPPCVPCGIQHSALDTGISLSPPLASRPLRHATGKSLYFKTNEQKISPNLPQVSGIQLAFSVAKVLSMVGSRGMLTKFHLLLIEPIQYFLIAGTRL